ncbi:GntR family transcriptional regulator [Microbacterium koreense]|uniref:GntR family transcriptional regulator n=1 Tax=Microbacterium koreense TaxID=323761 RepID=A0ABW2ZSS5_9MICO
MALVEDNHSRVQNAYDYLVAEITAFRIRTGAPLSENRIAAQLGISRTPVREALQRLEKEGLVRRTENARFTVAQPTTQEANEALDLLEVLDTYIARRAAELMTPEQVDQIRASVDRMVEAAAAGDRDAWSEADIAYHRVVNGIANNALVSETVKATRRRVQRFWLHAPSMGSRLEDCSMEHRVLADAMIEKRYDDIEPAVKEHISHMRERILDLLATTSVLFG